MMLDRDIVAVSSSTTYRVLKGAGLLDFWKPKPSFKGTGFVRRSALVELFADFRADQTPILRSLLHFLGILPEKLNIPGPIPSPGEARPPMRPVHRCPQACEPTSHFYRKVLSFGNLTLNSRFQPTRMILT